jgi:hypothetical protein
MVKLLITLWVVYQYTQSLQRYRLLPNSERKPLRDFTMTPMVTLKPLQSLMVVIKTGVGSTTL